jgi:hypothetical protein
VTWIPKVKIDHMVWSTLSHNLKESMPKQDQVWQPSYSQKEMKWQDSILCKLKLKELILYLIISIGCRSIKRDTTWITSKISMLTLPKKSSEMSETQWPHTLHISLNQKKQDSPISQTGASGFSCNGYISHSACSGFYWLVHND